MTVVYQTNKIPKAGESWWAKVGNDPRLINCYVGQVTKELVEITGGEYYKSRLLLEDVVFVTKC